MSYKFSHFLFKRWRLCILTSESALLTFDTCQVADYLTAAAGDAVFEILRSTYRCK